jgi:hypothetical protein
MSARAVLGKDKMLDLSINYRHADLARLRQPWPKIALAA